MKNRNLLIGLGLIVLAGGWLLFRPEKLFVNKTVSEGLPAATATNTASANPAPMTLLTGHFHSVAHESKGIATIYRLAGGERVLRLTEFETSNGPELQLYLVAAADAPDSGTVKKAGFVTLGPLKGNKGDQNYEVPADLDLAKFRAVTVWCRRFAVNFATAPLAPGK